MKACAIVGLLSLMISVDTANAGPEDKRVLAVGDQYNLEVQYHGDPWDRYRGALILRNRGSAVRLVSVEVNGRANCDLKLYGAPDSQIAGAPVVAFWLSADQVGGPGKFQGFSTIEPTLDEGDQILTYIPALTMMGMVPGPKCGTALVHLDLDTDAGTFSWDFGEEQQ